MIRSRIRKLAAWAGYGLGATQTAVRLGDRWRIRRSRPWPTLVRRGEERFLILIYHRVQDGDSAFWIDTTPVAHFDRQMTYLARHFHVLPLQDILRRIRQGEPLPKRCAAISFDDGYEDNFLHAFPILRRYELPATVFLVVGHIDTGAELWFDRVLHAFEHTRLGTIGLPWEETAIPLRTREERAGAAGRALSSLMSLPNAERLRRVETIVSSLDAGAGVVSASPMLRWSQIRAMAQGGVTFGSHTVTHPILTTISRTEAAWELTESKRVIESETGQPASIFAYPVGKGEHYSQDTMRLVADAGYDAALTTRPGANARNQNAYELKRIRSWDPALPDFALTLSYHVLLADSEV